MQKSVSLVILCFIFLQGTCSKQDSQVITKKVKSKYVDNREVSIFIPGEKYGPGPWPVLYMHNGQNVFKPEGSSEKETWNVDQILEQLFQVGMSPCVVVAIHSSWCAFQEFVPQKLDCVNQGGTKSKKTPLASDAYLKFIVEELKPRIDKKLPVKKDQPNTYIAGSGLAGLVSLYAISEYPETFGGAACLSTHWPLTLDNSNEACTDKMIKYFGFHLPDPDKHKIYFDYGTEGLDADYEPWQQKMDVLMRRAKYFEGENWTTQKFEGHDHSVRYWKQRFPIALKFLMGVKQ